MTRRLLAFAAALALAPAMTPIPALAHDDGSYCRHLAKKTRHFYLGSGSHGRSTPDPVAERAMEDCRNGNNIGAAIPVLEQKLRDQGIELPRH